MIRNKERLIQEKSEKILFRIKEYVNAMDELSDTDGFTIDQIERMWGDLGAYTDQIYKEINAEIISQTDEREMIKLKKKNTGKKD